MNLCGKLGIAVDDISEEIFKAYLEELSLKCVQVYLDTSKEEREKMLNLIDVIKKDKSKNREIIKNEIEEIKKVYMANHYKFVKAYKADFQKQREEKYAQVIKEAENILSK